MKSTLHTARAVALSVVVSVLAFAPMTASLAQTATTTHHVHRTHAEVKPKRPADKNPLRRVGGYIKTGARRTGQNLNVGARTTGNNIKQGSRAVGGGASHLARQINNTFGGKKDKKK